MNKEEAIKVLNSRPYVGEVREALETLIPELKESEDERIRKIITDSVFYQYGADKEYEDVLDYLDKLEKQKEANKAIDAVERIDKFIDEHTANAHDMKNSDPDKKYYLGWDAALGNMSGILQDVYSGEKQKEQKPKLYWHKIKAYEQLPCRAYIYKFAYEQENNFHGKATINGYLLPNDPVKIGCDTWYLPVEDIKNLPKEDELDTMNPIKTIEQKPAEWSEDYREEDIQTRFAFYTYKDDPSVLYLSNVFVEETSRNHGFGTKILRAAEKVAETIGATTISLKVKQDSPANAWYRKNGYGYVAFEDGYDWLEKNLEYMKPNKQGWSEEDEKMLENIRYALGYAYSNNVIDEQTTEYVTTWLKSLRPQSKIHYWTEEEIELIISDYLTGKEHYGGMIARLRCLKPKSHWKPSEEQLDAVRYVSQFDYGGHKAVLVSLYKQLKQL